LIDQKKAGDLPVLTVDQYAYVVNMTTAKKLNMFPSVEILQIAETVEWFSFDRGPVDLSFRIETMPAHLIRRHC
jgi:hypothetical protein